MIEGLLYGSPIDVDSLRHSPLIVVARPFWADLHSSSCATNGIHHAVHEVERRG